jgi:hypothetical protein
VEDEDDDDERWQRQYHALCYGKHHSGAPIVLNEV